MGHSSAVSIGTVYRLDGPGIKPQCGRYFPHCPDLPWGSPSLLYNGYQIFPGGKATGQWHWPPTPTSSAEVKGRVKLYICSTSAPSGPFPGWILPLFLPLPKYWPAACQMWGSVKWKEH